MQESIEFFLFEDSLGASMQLFQKSKNSLSVPQTFPESFVYLFLNLKRKVQMQS
jgi:hypothetical protein